MEYQPFEIIRLIRDRIATNARDLQVGTCPFNIGVDHFVNGLLELGLITKNEKEDLRPRPELTALFRKLGLSLNHLANYSPGTTFCTPIFWPPTSPTKKAKVFVVMPFDEQLQPIYTRHIKPVARKLGLTVARADDFFNANIVISDIWAAMNVAEIVIADCTGRNPNVFYEIGMAHVLGKPVILLAQTMADVPFDVQHWRVVVYGTDEQALGAFDKKLEETLRLQTLERTSLETRVKEEKGQRLAARRLRRSSHILEIRTRTKA
jgi:nucleoside 2-deoxyribosyltransferase